MRSASILMAAALVCAPAFMVGCDRTATTETTHTDSTPNGTTVKKETTKTDVDTGQTTKETVKEQVKNP